MSRDVSLNLCVCASASAAASLGQCTSAPPTKNFYKGANFLFALAEHLKIALQVRTQIWIFSFNFLS